MSGYTLLADLSLLEWNTWCHDCETKMRVKLHRPYSRSPDTIRIDMECLNCGEFQVIEVKE